MVIYKGEISLIKLYKGDCLMESDKIKDGSIDLIITDPHMGL